MTKPRRKNPINRGFRSRARTVAGLQQEVLVGRYVGHGKRRFCGTVRWTETEASRQAAKRTGPGRDRQQPAKPTGDPKASRPAARKDVVSPPLHQDAATLEKVRPRIRRHRLVGLDMGESGLADLEGGLYVRIDERHVELRPESHNTAHEVMKLDLAMHILQIEGVVVGALIRGLDDTMSETERKNQHR